MNKVTFIPHMLPKKDLHIK